MKQIFLIGFMIILITAIFIVLSLKKNMVVVYEGNMQRLPIEMVVGKYQDSDCGMVINELKDVSQVVLSDGKTYFFHDHGGMAKWLSDKNLSDVKIWVKTRDTKKFIEATNAYFSLIDETPMGYGFGAYEMKNDKFVSFEEMKLKMVRGENMKNKQIAKQLLAK